ncbi:alpha/beta hydrolase [Flavobacterium sp. xlx-214]|uniref:alpha/beta fold hydrolase n=1 Tax=unclassified Flavobacterium TaxID=196869 RepID=UPI0013D66F87|nr:MULTISPECIES: alpha/beta hydrolase [unclassified Flavobacterium]MBA5793162.1 alpha/beta hydrolase [Flavobacterium sp. xlx-221]QMI82554.1 alpha/beta hydrolase [Flavobacterium sp. xlx-214]
MAQKQSKVLEVPSYIRNTSKVLSALNKKMAAAFALKLFETPIKYTLPKREQKMFEVSHKSKITLPICKKEIIVYENNFGPKKVLLVHGWNGRGTQLVSIAKMFKELNYNIISFDAPGHGRSPKATTNMKDFIEAIFELDKKYNGFDVIVGHSLGGMSIINSLGRGLKTTKTVTIGAGNKTKDITDDFLLTIGMNVKISPLLIQLFEQKYQDKMSNYDVDQQAKKTETPVLVIHDQNDKDVPYTAAIGITDNLKNHQLFLTKGLGHRKILGDAKVIETIKEFILN